MKIDKDNYGAIVKKLAEAVSAMYIGLAENKFLEHYPVAISEQNRLETLNSIIAKYGLNTEAETPFGYCPVFADGDDNGDIHTCAVCFGIMALDNGFDLNGVLDLQKKRNSLINTLIAMYISDDKYGYWPTVMHYSNNLASYIIETGTYNQTTTALSTLINCDFLSPPNNNINDDQLESRYKLAISCLNWIISKQSDTYGAWSYGADCTATTEIKNSITSAVLPSFFCYETMMKYISFFTSDKARLDIIAKIDPNILCAMRRSCKKFESWVVNNTSDDGGIKKTSLTGEAESFIHTCLATIIYTYDCRGLRPTHFNKMVNFICQNKNKLCFNESEKTCETYEYKYTAILNDGNSQRYQSDTYEIMAYPVVINSLCKLLDSFAGQRLNRYQKRSIQEIIYILHEKMEKQVVLRPLRPPYDENEQTVVKGVQGRNKSYPIYGIYNVQVTCMRLMENENRNDLTKVKYSARPSRLIYVVLLIALAVAILALCVVGQHIDSKAFWLSIITGIISSSAIVGLIVALVYRISPNLKNSFISKWLPNRDNSQTE